MQAKILDFKQALEVNPNKTNKKEFKNNGFSEKLNSANENNNAVKKQSARDENNIKSNQKNEVKASDQGKDKEIKKNEKEELIEEPKEDNEIQYETMMNILNIKEIKESPEVEIKEFDKMTKVAFISEESLNSEKNLLLEESDELINFKGSETNPKKLEEINSENLAKENFIEVDEKEIKPELITNNINKEKITSEVNESEELSLGEEANPLSVKENFSEKTKDESQSENQKDETDSNENYELVETSINEENVEVSNESFGPIIKNGLEFSTDRIVDAEMPQLEPEKVIKQIVDQVKFDLSENKNEIKLSLKPETLGEMTMNIELAKDGIIARIMVDNYKTKEVIESNIFQLKEGIKDTGMEIKTFEVFVGNGSDFDQHESSQFNFNQNNKKLKIKNQNKKNNNFIDGYEEGTVSKSNNLDGNNIEGGLNLFA